jgi:hypothetical protein
LPVFVTSQIVINETCGNNNDTSYIIVADMSQVVVGVRAENVALYDPYIGEHRADPSDFDIARRVRRARDGSRRDHRKRPDFVGVEKRAHIGLQRAPGRVPDPRSFKPLPGSVCSLLQNPEAVMLRAKLCDTKQCPSCGWLMRLLVDLESMKQLGRTDK